MADNNTIGGIHYEMMRRCYNKKSVSYKDYGEKGIAVCPEWHNRDNFRSWAMSSGYKKGLRLVRIDSAKDYTPDNCIWSNKYTARHGNAYQLRERAKANKAKKRALGIERVIDSPLLKTYYSMRARCENPNHKNYKHYGGRGISVCEEWKCKDGIYDFLKWAKTSGWHPGLTLDRIDNDKGYSPENCRWATPKEQIRNRRNTKLYEYKGFMLTVSEIAEAEKIPAVRLRYRLNKGLSLSEAITDTKSSLNK